MKLSTTNFLKINVMNKPISISTNSIHMDINNAILFADPYLEQYQTDPENLQVIVKRLYDQSNIKTKALLYPILGLTKEAKDFIAAFKAMVEENKLTEKGTEFSNILAETEFRLCFENYVYDQSGKFIEVNRLYHNTSKEQRDYICSLDYQTPLMKEFLDIFKQCCLTKETLNRRMGSS